MSLNPKLQRSLIFAAGSVHGSEGCPRSQQSLPPRRRHRPVQRGTPRAAAGGRHRGSDLRLHHRPPVPEPEKVRQVLVRDAEHQHWFQPGAARSDQERDGFGDLLPERGLAVSHPAVRLRLGGPGVEPEVQLLDPLGRHGLERSARTPWAEFFGRLSPVLRHEGKNLGRRFHGSSLGLC